MIKSVYTLWQVRDTFPSAKELKAKGKSVSFDIFWTGMHGATSGIRGLPKLYKIAQDKLVTNE